MIRQKRPMPLWCLAHRPDRVDHALIRTNWKKWIGVLCCHGAHFPMPKLRMHRSLALIASVTRITMCAILPR